MALNLDANKLNVTPDIYIVSVGQDAIEFSFNLANTLRLNKEFIVITDTLQRGLKAQMKEANKINAKYAIIIGDDEITAKKLTIKNMDTGHQETINIDKIESFFNSKN